MLTVTIFAAAAALATVALRARRDGADERATQARSATPIGEVAEGRAVVIAGRLELAGAPLCAPVSGRACAAYSATIEYHDRRYRRRVAHEQEAREFIVRDESGAQALVRDPQELRSERSAVLRPTIVASRLSRRLRRFLRRHGLAELPSLDGAPYADRCDEAALEEGQRVTVIGVGWWEPHPTMDVSAAASGYRDPPRRIVFVSATVIA